MKTRKFADGGETDPDIEKANATDDPIAYMNKAKGWTGAAAKTPSFKAAFAAARSAGDKSFEWNGKKYSTAVSPAVNPTLGEARDKNAQAAADAIDPGDRRTRELMNTRGSRPANYSRNTRTGATAKMMQPSYPSKESVMERRTQYEKMQDESAPSTFRKGGAVKKYAKGGSIDGIAQRGKTRGKTRGKIC